MDAIGILTRQHREMEHLFAQWMKASTQDEKHHLFTGVADQLSIHITTEEQIFYPAVKAKRTEDILLESLEEHLSLKRLLADLIQLYMNEQNFEPKFKVIKEQAVEKILDENQRNELGQRILAAQKELNREVAPAEVVLEQTEAAAPLQ